MSESARAADWKAPPRATEKRAAGARRALSSKRDFKLGRRRVGEFSAPESAMAPVEGLFSTYNPDAIKDGVDRGECLVQLTILDQIVRAQNTLLLEDFASRYPGVTPAQLMRYAHSLGELVPRLLQLLETDPRCQPLCAALLANLTAMAESEQHVLALLNAGAHETFGRILGEPATRCSATDTLISIICCVGNICLEHGQYRNAVLPALTPALLQVSRAYPDQLKDVAFVVYAMCVRHAPAPSPALMDAWAPWMMETLLTLQPIDGDSVSVYPVKCIAIALQELCASDEGARVALAANPRVVARLAEFAVSSAVAVDVRAISTDVLAQLVREPQHHEALAPSLVPAFGRVLMSPDPYARVAACRGLGAFARAGAVPPLLAVEVREPLLVQARQGTNAVRTAALDVLNLAVPHMDSEALGAWLDAGLAAGLYENFGIIGRGAQEMLRFFTALEAAFRDRTHGAAAREQFDALGAEDALERLSATTTDVLVGERVEQILERYFHGTNDMHVD